MLYVDADVHRFSRMSHMSETALGYPNPKLVTLNFTSVLETGKDSERVVSFQRGIGLRVLRGLLSILSQNRLNNSFILRPESSRTTKMSECDTVNSCLWHEMHINMYSDSGGSLGERR